MSESEMRRVPERLSDSHKGDYGRILLIGGSRGMAGSIALAGMAALRGGAGLVSVATPDVCADLVAGFHPSYMTIPLPSDPQGLIHHNAYTVLEEHIERADCIALGPGLQRSEAVSKLVGRLYRSVSKPLVIDADGLNALAEQRHLLLSRPGPRIFTPHGGEFGRLLGEEAVNPNSKAGAEAAEQFAKEAGGIVVLKGNRTLITDGATSFRNETGNPGMATGGSGDVLTGLVAAFVGQGMSPLDAARYAVYVHGRAGDMAVDFVGQIALTSKDIVDFLPPALMP